MLQMIGGAVMVAGGGMLTASSVVMAQVHRRAAAFGRGLREVFADTAAEAPPADMQALIDRIP